MILAKYSDKELVVNIFTKAFDSNKSVNHVIKQGKNRITRIRSLMEYSFNQCWYFGEIFLTDDKLGTVLLMYPEKKKSSIRSIISDISLIFKSIGIFRVSKVLDRESKIKKCHPDKYIHLWYIGILPEYQGEGRGSSLLKNIVEMANTKKLPVYLETSVLENLSLYGSFGFEIFKEINFDYKLYLLKKEPE